MSYLFKLQGHERPALVINSRGESVAQVFTDCEPGDQYGNAALFAAAPDLLAALQSLDAARGHTFHKPAGGRGYDAVVIPRDVFDAAMAAIAKATGESA